MQHLCQKSNWPASIQTLVRELLGTGLVDKGLKGELYSRLLLILAHDWVQSGARFRDSLGSDPAKGLPSFTVDEFLKSLYAKDYHLVIGKIDSRVRKARLNFTHFVSAGEFLSSDVILPLCHDLLRRNAALQLAPNQPTYGQLIPIYYGDEGSNFDQSECGFILVQDKKKAEASIPSKIFGLGFTEFPPEAPEGDSPRFLPDTDSSVRDNREKFIFNGFVNPILLLLLDLGVTKNIVPDIELVKVSCSREAIPHVWAIHSQGHGEKVFGCLDGMGCSRASEGFFASLNATSNTPHDFLVDRNAIFRRLARGFRYLGFD
jgi:hypothetical protein